MLPKVHTTLMATTPMQIHITRQLRKKSKSRRPHTNMLKPMNKYTASDLHLKAGNPPILRVQGKVRYFDSESLEGPAIERMLHEIVTPLQREALARGEDLDFAHSVPKVGRYRINAFRQRGSMSLAVRRVNTEIPTFEQLNLQAEVMRRVASLRQGLVVVAGITGSGKSTTLAAMIEYINGTRRCSSRGIRPFPGC